MSLNLLVRYAERYHANGLVVIPLRGKIPNMKEWQTATVEKGLRAVKHRARNGWLENIGIVAGRNSGNLFQLEIDGLDLYHEALEAIPALQDTWTVLSGSGNGVHIYGRADELPPTTAEKLPGEHLEVRFKSDGQQCVAPPSIHPTTGNRYTNHVHAPIRHFDKATVDAILAFIESKRPAHVVSPKPTTKPREHSAPLPAAREDEVAEALSYIPADSIEYLQWIAVQAGLKDEFGESAAIRLAEQWSGWCSKPGEIERTITAFKDTYRGAKATIGTVYHLARQNGYERPKPAQNSPKPSQNGKVSTPTRVHSKVPDSWRSVLLRYLSGYAALIYEWITLVCNAGLLNPNHITRPALKSACKSIGIEPSKSVLDAGLDELAKQRFVIPGEARSCAVGRQAPVYALVSLTEQYELLYQLALPHLVERRFPSDPTADRPAIAAPLSVRALHEGLGLDNDTAVQTVGDLEDASKPAYVVQPDEQRRARKGLLRDDEQLKAWLNDRTSADLPHGWQINGVKEFRIALLRAWTSHYPEGTWWLNGDKGKASALGISVNTFKDYADLAGVDRICHQTKEFRLTSPVNVERRVNQLRYKARGMCMAFRVKNDTGREIEYQYSHENTARVSNLIAEGAEVTAIYKAPNKHVVRPDAQPPEPVQRQRPATSGERPKAEPRPRMDEDVEDEPRRRVGYSPEWVHKQLILRLRLMGWQRGDNFLNPHTGEVVPIHAPPLKLVELLIGRSLNYDPLLKVAEELGAIVTRVSA